MLVCGSFDSCLAELIATYLGIEIFKVLVKY